MTLEPPQLDPFRVFKIERGAPSKGPREGGSKGFKPTPTLPSRAGDAKAKLLGHCNL